jgi:NADPH:quinone reductase-like Zn-dependent oxidoreductase
MKALRFDKFGPVSVLAIAEVPTPEPGAGEALVRVAAAAINPSDVKNVGGHLDAYEKIAKGAVKRKQVLVFG